MTTETTALPTWDDLSDLDKGAALLHMWKRNWEGAGYAIREYPVRYIEHPALVALCREDPYSACAHALRVAGSWEKANDRLGNAEVQRLYDLALDHERSDA